LTSIFEAKQQTFDWKKYHAQFYEGVKASHLKHEAQVPEESQARIESAGGLYKYSYGYSNSHMN